MAFFSLPSFNVFPGFVPSASPNFKSPPPASYQSSLDLQLPPSLCFSCHIFFTCTEAFSRDDFTNLVKESRASLGLADVFLFDHPCLPPLPLAASSAKPQPTAPKIKAARPALKALPSPLQPGQDTNSATPYIRACAQFSQESVHHHLAPRKHSASAHHTFSGPSWSPPSRCSPSTGRR